MRSDGRFIRARTRWGGSSRLALGVVSLIIAGLIFSNGVLEFIVGIVVAAVLLAIWARLAPRAAH